MQSENNFLDSFPDHAYRYIDQTGEGRKPFSSLTKSDTHNIMGYEAYFTVNGFKDSTDQKRESCTNLNAFFVDIDGRKDSGELESIKAKLDPTFIVETQNGHHVYWLLDEPIYKAETPEWEEMLSQWDRQEQAIVHALNGDKKAQDVCRILRQPDTFYWKKSGAKYHDGTDGVFKIKLVYERIANRYSMKTIAEAFPVAVAPTSKTPTKDTNASEIENFFKKVDLLYPIEERDSFKALVSGWPGTVKEGGRNRALLVTASLMKRAGWGKAKALAHFSTVGWHGIEKERGGDVEIATTVNSAFSHNYTFSYKDECIFNLMSEDEKNRMQEVYNGVFKERKEIDRLRFRDYEYTILKRNPNLKKTDNGMIFDYSDGVYREMNDQEVNNLIFVGLYDDMLWEFRTGRFVSDKVKCLISIVPDLIKTDDGGRIVNVKNGLLDIYTRELKPHTPDFISLVQFPVEYKADATCPVWDECMDAWMEGPEKDEKKFVLQQYAGYCLSSSMTYDRALFLIGDGGNGKSTFVDAISRVVGYKNVSQIDLEMLDKQFGMRGLIGKRINVIEEVHGNYYQSNNLKKLISGEPIMIDVKFKNQVSFQPEAKFIFAVNTMPRIDDTSTATERRIITVNFLNNFRDKPNTNLRYDRGLLARSEEQSGILNWMIKGAQLLKEAGNFTITQDQRDTLTEYRKENSSVDAFVAECLEFVEGNVVDSKELYEEYKINCTDNGRKFKARISFTKEMKAMGKRTKKFGYFDRVSGHEDSRFEGIKVRQWSSDHAFRHEF